MGKYKFEVVTLTHPRNANQKKETVIIESDNINLDKQRARPLVVEKMNSTTGKNNYVCDGIDSIRRI